MKPIRIALACLLLLGCFLTNCKQENKITPTSSIPSDDLDKIARAGFSTYNVQDVDSGYIVEGDIFLRYDYLDTKPNSPILRIAESEQYHTYALVTGTPRVISISVAAGLPTVFTTALDEAIARYNALGLKISFQRVSSGANISITTFYQAPNPDGSILLGSSGFPSGGNPYSSVTLNTHPQAYGSSPDMLYLASVIQHEVGHCIGFRHTDYFNRNYSCNYSTNPNEGEAGIGAVHIPGTPTSEDPNSFMLACTSFGLNRSFNTNDVIALQSLYGSCDRVDQRYINGVCETAQIELTNVTEAPRGYVCSYSYVWSDGSEVPYKTVRTAQGCPSNP